MPRRGNGDGGFSDASAAPGQWHQHRRAVRTRLRHDLSIARCQPSICPSGVARRRLLAASGAALENARWLAVDRGCDGVVALTAWPGRSLSSHRELACRGVGDVEIITAIGAAPGRGDSCCPTPRMPGAAGCSRSPSGSSRAAGRRGERTCPRMATAGSVTGCGGRSPTCTRPKWRVAAPRFTVEADGENVGQLSLIARVSAFAPHLAPRPA